MDIPRVSIVILNWNGLNDTIDCLESLKNITDTNYSVILVDNGSTGNDAGILEAKYGKYLAIIRNDKNYGVPGGRNVGIRYALHNTNPDYVLFLDNDMVVDSEFLKQMVTLAERSPLIGLVGAKIYMHSNPSRFQAVWYKFNMWRGRYIGVGSGEVDRGQYNRTEEVDYIGGACYLVKRMLFNHIGLMDEGYHYFWDEVDYCFRVRKGGYKIVYAPLAHVWHKRVTNRTKPWYKTLRRRDQDELMANISPLRVHLSTLDGFRFIKKHATRLQYFCYLLYYFTFLFWEQSLVFLLYYRRLSLVKVFMKGTKEGLLLKV